MTFNSNEDDTISIIFTQTELADLFEEIVVEHEVHEGTVLHTFAAGAETMLNTLGVPEG